MCNQAEPGAVSVARGLSFSKLIQEEAVFLIGIRCRSNRDDSFQVTPCLAPQFCAQTKTCRGQ